MEKSVVAAPLPSCFIPFSTPISHIPLPECFTFPFYYQPHPLSIIAAQALQHYLETQNDWVHNFGLKSEYDDTAIGKMFGVLVVQSQDLQLGYLAAFSGKLAGKSLHRQFVPPIYDMLQSEGFFRKEEALLVELNKTIEQLEQSEKLVHLRQQFTLNTKLAEEAIIACKESIKLEKAARKIQREQARQYVDNEAFVALEARLRQESIQQQYFLKDLHKSWKLELESLQHQLDVLEQEIEILKQTRRQKSANLQQWLFEQYQFLNQYRIPKGLETIFGETIHKQPPSGAGDCAAPKLLQYAFQYDLKPIALAEFWWGQSPKLEIRKHKYYYPACRGKCEPILKHMLEGIPLDPNPLLLPAPSGKKVDILYEDDFLLVVHKPEEMLSVPGKSVSDSVLLRIQQKYSKAAAPLMVHRLDRATSGVMLIAKTKHIHKALQQQFLKRVIEKRYVALLDGHVLNNEGTIDLPLRVDLDDRPRQMVCYEHGKSARTHWQVISRNTTQTRLYFFPITGRTHQLRVHAAHPSGLGIPILGDDLYGKPANRLYLHAERLTFTHPASDEKMTFEVLADF